MKKVVALIASFFAIFLCISCSDYADETKYSVVFFVDGEIVAEQTIERGDLIYAVDIPVREGFDAYWTDESGKRVDFPVYAVENKTYRVVYVEKIIEQAYIIEYYLEQNDGSFVADSSKRKVYDMFAGVTVYANIVDIEEYAFDESNADNVLQCVTEFGKSFILKLYYLRTSVSVEFVAEGNLIKEIKVVKNQPFTPTDIIAPAIEGKKFVYWSEQPNGTCFDFDGVSCDKTLYAVYRDEDWSALSVELETDLYYLIDDKGEALADDAEFDVRNIESGEEFVFSIIIKKEVFGVAIVTVYQTDENGNTVSEILTPDKRGYYTVKVRTHTVIKISGLESFSDLSR